MFKLYKTMKITFNLFYFLGVGKSYCVDICNWMLCGATPSDKSKNDRLFYPYMAV